jgi:uracil-DNA glycosylase family protein
MNRAATERPSAPVPKRLTRTSLRRALQECRACDLWEGATQAVMGEGAPDATVMLVGEQPGDREDREGHPFVGPAGRVLDSALERAHIERDDTYITNVVKHFRYKARGKRRIHQRPDRWQVTACMPWLHAELEMVKPAAVVLLGATAAQALLGSGVRIGRDRGKPMDSSLADLVTVTAHPSSILRAEDDEQRSLAMEQLVDDLGAVAAWLARRGD